MTHEPLERDSAEPTIADPEELGAHRRRRLALGYRVLGARGWGSMGDGHISARDPERLDHFWLLRYGVPFSQATVADLVLVGPDGSVVEGPSGATINGTGYNIHWPIHEARPDAVAACHTHTSYGTPFSAERRKLRPLCQEACGFFDDHGLFLDSEVAVVSTEGGKRIAADLADHRAVILANHGLLTVGASVDEAIGWFLMMELCAEVEMKATAGQPLTDAEALVAKRHIDEAAAWHAYNFAVRTLVPDTAVVGS